ncbi:Catabolite control protein A [Caprobacter fermentans]|uniref:Catabolite control protein A n=1 Tax=Caproicibacter fermentans TaxID=2576756 RepID=A0A6N8I3Z2_9FIRM|nr:LacI family DNA-binding transcriptional regulator [Caproicibacter fermentans]MVB12467.1 Catabolite control protein A [Caproicibacter fermentans]OCN01488.1 LacI family transcriptional regulator [Clostridium sp. W14A]QNK40559.1 LacI family DNA-binding transcriptional regulator [Caproicibacter fermentans]
MLNNPTIKDVAEKANVSVATVSRVLNGLTGFSAETEVRVRNAIAELGYQFNAVARNLKLKKTNIIAVLIPQVETTFYVKILNGIEDAAQNCGYSVMVCHVGISGNRTQEYIKMLAERQVDGIIGCSLPPDEKIDTLMAECEIPCVLVSTLSSRYSIPYIRVDDFKASYAATTYLISKGHKNIAMLAGSQDDVVAGVLRLKGYRKALEDNRIPYSPKLVQYTRFSYETGLQAAKDLLNSGESFTGVVACCDEVAVGAISAAYEAGLKVPDAFSVIGYDNTRTAEMAVPPLTTVSQPLYPMGEQAFHMLQNEMEQGKKAENQILPYEIVERDSVKKV